MRYLVVIMTLLFASVSAAQNTSYVSESEPTFEAVDQDMIELLQLRGDQVDGYLKVIRSQRKALRVLSDSQWQKQLGLYKGTIDMLRPVLNKTQLTKFSAYLGCLIVEREYDTHLSKETNGIDKTNQELPSIEPDQRNNVRTPAYRLSPELPMFGIRSEPVFARVP